MRADHLVAQRTGPASRRRRRHRLVILVLAGLALALPSGSSNEVPTKPEPGTATPARSGSAPDSGPVDPAPATPQPGALPVGTTRYPVPADARFVSEHGNDGGAGTMGDPWATVGHAVNTVGSGATVVVRGGTYRERVLIPAETRITLQAYPGEAVWFSGSVPVTGWVPDGDMWRHDGWTPRFRHDGLDPTLIDPAHPMAGHPDMAFLDGVPLVQVDRREVVGPGTFHVDETARQLWIGDDPNRRVVEASTLADGLLVRSAGSVIRGIGFQHFATAIPQNGAVKVSGRGAVVEHVEFRLNAAAGLSITGTDVVVRRVTASGNGQLGIHAHRADRLELLESLVAGNNSEGFSPDAAAGGAKITASTDTLVKGNRAEANNGHGLWLDVDADRSVIAGNATVGNVAGAGIMFEYSTGAVIAGNVSAGNGTGIQAGEASDVQIWNNTVVDNGSGIRVYDGERPTQPVGFSVRNNLISAGPAMLGPLLFVEDVNGVRTWQEMGWSSDHNAFAVADGPNGAARTNRDLVVLADGPRPNLRFGDVEQVADGTSLEAHSLLVDGTGGGLVRGEGEGLRLSTDGSSAPPDGTPLQAVIADALALPDGSSIGIGAPAP